MTYPKTVYLLRHAEETGDKDNPHLSLQGKRRAEVLFRLFGFGGRLDGVNFLFSTDTSKHSNRCVETLTPLSRLLGLDIDHHYDDDEYRDLAKRIKSKERYQGAVVLIAWHHGNLPNLAKALGVPSSELPSKKWPDDIYDRVWILDFDGSGLTGIRSELQGLEI